MIYSEMQLRNLAKSNPKELSRILISPNADVHTLTFGSEILGNEVTDESLVLPPLRVLLKHVHATVREGAMIGISSFYTEIDKKPPQDVLDRFKVIGSNDPSPTLKEFARDLLKDLELLK